MITVQTTTNVSLSKVWDFWTNPKHIVNWNFASPDWHCPTAENDLQVGGEFVYRMAAKNEEMFFDFAGNYDNVIENQLIEYTIIDGRKVIIEFYEIENGTEIFETFQPENENSLELQQQGWQAILDNFKKYVEKN